MIITRRLITPVILFHEWIIALVRLNVFCLLHISPLSYIACTWYITQELARHCRLQTQWNVNLFVFTFLSQLTALQIDWSHNVQTTRNVNNFMCKFLSQLTT